MVDALPELWSLMCFLSNVYTSPRVELLVRSTTTLAEGLRFGNGLLVTGVHVMALLNVTPNGSSGFSSCVIDRDIADRSGQDPASAHTEVMSHGSEETATC